MFATFGVGRGRLLVETKMEPMPQYPDPMFYFGDGDPVDPNSAVISNWRRSRILAEAAYQGLIDTRLGHQWIVSFYSIWDERYRPAIAKAYGNIDKKEIKLPLQGDL